MRLPAFPWPARGSHSISSFLQYTAPNFTPNSPGTNPHTAGNRWNSNDPDSMFEIVIRGLRATFWGSMRGMDSVCDSSAMGSAIASVTTRQTVQRRPKRWLATEKHAPATRPLTAAPISCLGTATLRNPPEEPTGILELVRDSSALEGIAAQPALQCSTPEEPNMALEFVGSAAEPIGRTR